MTENKDKLSVVKQHKKKINKRGIQGIFVVLS